MEEVILENWECRMELMGGLQRDLFLLSGDVIGHPKFADGSKVSVSTPVSFDQETMTVTTTTGRKYKLGRCASNISQQISYILDDVESSKNRKSG